MTLPAGAFVSVAPSVYGFAARHDLPAWVPRVPTMSAAGQAVDGLVIHVDDQSGLVLISPRLLALRRARDAGLRGDQMSGTVIDASLDGVSLDVNGSPAFAPRAELDLGSLLAGARSGTRWQGHVIDVTENVVLMSSFSAGHRAHRAMLRERLLTQLKPGTAVQGTVIACDVNGLVSLADGLLWGVVGRTAMAAPVARRLRPDRRAWFRVLGVEEDDVEGHVRLRLWPHASST